MTTPVKAHDMSPTGQQTDPRVDQSQLVARLETERASLLAHPWWYRLAVNAWTQIVLVSLVCFCLPGMYNAISGMGGSGQLDPTVAANASVALLSVGAACVIFIAQPVFDIVGIKTILLGGWTYALYTGSLLNYNRTGNSAFVIASGALLGLGAAFLWITQGAIMLSYPLPHQKGRSIALFWVIFNLGGGIGKWHPSPGAGLTWIGSFISLGINYHRTTAGTVSDATYIAYMVIMLVGWVACLLLLPPHMVRRSDGSHAAPHPADVDDSVKWHQRFWIVGRREVLHIIALKDEWRIWFLMPMCFAANWFYSYQQNIVNGGAFTLRSRSLNSSLYWLAQCAGGVIMGFLLDMPWVGRRGRAIIGWTFVFVTGMVIMGGGLAFQNWFEAQGKTHFIDFSDSKLYVGPCFLYIFYGMYDAFWQSLSYWLLGALCNTPKEAARYVAIYKSLQSAGGAVAYRLTANHLSGRKQFISNWCVIAIMLVFALPTVLAITEPTAQEAAGDFLTEDEDRPGAKNKQEAALKHGQLLNEKVVA